MRLRCLGVARLIRSRREKITWWRPAAIRTNCATTAPTPPRTAAGKASLELMYQHV